ncbi:DUF6361 family protein [Stenotrophomonas sp. PS02289]|uniref:DUF6361 family protein n=1 Tax=Stenotrophomonas sp. PS02289 TaxID=2991422 RepID=UPI00249C3491|nr:DUF6361 family protein [Stenotrophomonas sp. PS02289]
MASQIAWMSFDQNQLQRTQLFLNALSERGTVDELGTGIIRDLISGMLFPGHTVLHTRAKYLLFLPRDLSRLSSKTVDALAAEGRGTEGHRIKALRQRYQDEGLRSKGIIGYTTGSQTKQLPSSSYWGLMRQLGIYRGEGSLWDYYRELAAHNASRAQNAMLHSEEDGELPTVTGLWAEYPAESSGFDGFDLSPDEAVWLRERFLESDKSHQEERSLTSWLLDKGGPRSGREWVSKLDYVWNHPLVAQFPARTAQAMWLGRDTDQLLFGARILYNYLCAYHRPDQGAERDALLDKYRTAMNEWRSQIDAEPPRATLLTELDDWAQRRFGVIRAGGEARIRWRDTLRFVQRWQQLIQNSADLLADRDAHKHLMCRERSLKPGRARLEKPNERLQGWGGDAGYFRFDFNWLPAWKILDDIHAGLRTPRVAIDGETD